MSAQPATILASNFVALASGIEQTRVKVEGLLGSNHIDRDDLERVYGGLYLELFTGFEEVLDKLFFGLMTASFSSTKCVPLASSTTSAVIQNILLLGKNYLDWLPYSRTRERAHVVFQKGEPFTLLTPTQDNDLQKYTMIRNAIAHGSSFSIQKFVSTVIGGTALLPRERTPRGYLGSQFRVTPVMTQFEQISQEMQGMVNVLCQ